MKYYKICRKCNYFSREEEKDNFCPFCGTELIAVCPNCGEKIDNPYAEYCKYCGEKYRKIEHEDNSNEFLF